MHRSRRFRSMLRSRILAAALVSTLAATALGACGTDATGVESCRRVEEARCRRGPECNVDMNIPVHRGDTPAAGVSACIRWYKDACLHGLVASDPGAPSVQACVDAINVSSCDVVLRPESHPSCAWLIPPDAPPPEPEPDAGATEEEPDATPSLADLLDAAGIPIPPVQ